MSEEKTMPVKHAPMKKHVAVGCLLVLGSTGMASGQAGPVRVPGGPPLLSRPLTVRLGMFRWCDLDRGDPAAGSAEPSRAEPSR